MANRFCDSCGAPLSDSDMLCPECNAPCVIAEKKTEKKSDRDIKKEQQKEAEKTDKDLASGGQKNTIESHGTGGLNKTFEKDGHGSSGGNGSFGGTDSSGGHGSLGGNGGSGGGTKPRVPLILVTVLGAVLIALISALISVSGQPSYEVVIKDCTWQQAFDESLEAGGHLVTIETEKEYKKLVSLLSEADFDKIRLYISAARDDNSDKYYWIDKDMYFVGEALNGEKSYARNVWKSGNPSMVNSENTSIVENRVELQHTASFQWDYNDVANNILDADPGWAGRIGYIIEYD